MTTSDFDDRVFVGEPDEIDTIEIVSRNSALFREAARRLPDGDDVNFDLHYSKLGRAEGSEALKRYLEELREAVRKADAGDKVPLEKLNKPNFGSSRFRNCRIAA